MSSSTGFEFFDHTADIGIRVRAATRPELVSPACQGLYAAIGELAHEPGATPRTVDILRAGRPGAALLLRDFLSEMLALFESEQRVAVRLEVEQFDDLRLRLTAHTALVDQARSVYHREVKAVTYHELEVCQTADGYEATFIVDI